MASTRANRRPGAIRTVGALVVEKSIEAIFEDIRILLSGEVDKLRAEVSKSVLEDPAIAGHINRAVELATQIRALETERREAVSAIEKFFGGGDLRSLSGVLNYTDPDGYRDMIGSFVVDSLDRDGGSIYELAVQNGLAWGRPALFLVSRLKAARDRGESYEPVLAEIAVREAFQLAAEIRSHLDKEKGGKKARPDFAIT